MIAASRPLRALVVVSAALALPSGCATLIGIDEDYRDQQDGGGGQAVTAVSGGGAGSGSTTSGTSSSVGTGGGGGAGGELGDTVILGVHRGSADLPTGMSLQKVAIPRVDPTRSFLVFGASFDSELPSASAVSGQITGPSELTFARTGMMNTPSIPIRYYVAEFQGGVRVQRGTTPMFTSTVILPLPQAVDLTKSFPIATFRNVGSLFDLGDFVRAKLTAASELTLELGEAAPSGVVEWQVVTVHDATVTSGDVTFTGSEAALSVPLAGAIDPAKTWLMLSYKVDSSNLLAAEFLFRGRVASPTELAFEREATGTTGRLTWYAVSFDNGTTVQSGVSSFGINSSASTAPLDPVDPARSIAVTRGIYQRCGKTTHATDGNPGYGTYTLDIEAGSTLSLARGAFGSAGDADWSVVTFE